MYLCYVYIEFEATQNTEQCVFRRVYIFHDAAAVFESVCVWVCET